MPSCATSIGPLGGRGDVRGELVPRARGRARVEGGTDVAMTAEWVPEHRPVDECPVEQCPVELAAVAADNVLLNRLDLADVEEARVLVPRCPCARWWSTGRWVR